MMFARQLLSVASPAGRRAKLSILIYHRVLEREDPLTGEVSAETFNTHLASAKSCFNVLPLDEAIERLQAEDLPPRSLSITFDDGYLDNVEIALPLLRHHGLTATFFIADHYLGGGRMFNDVVIESVRLARRTVIDASFAGLGQLPVGSIAEKRSAVTALLRATKYLAPSDRRDAADRLHHACDAPVLPQMMMDGEHVTVLARGGMGIGAHTSTHPILTRITDADAEGEIQRNRSTLQTLAAKPVRLFAYPNGKPDADYGRRHVDLVRRLGFAGAVTTSWGAATQGADPFQLPRFTPWDRKARPFVARLVRNLILEAPKVAAA